MTMQMLVADVGGTNTRCGLCTDDQSVSHVKTFVNDHYATLADVLETYLGEKRPTVAALGIAGPVLSDQVQMLNRTWSFSQIELQRRLHLERLDVVNDFTALAYALPLLTKESLHQVGGGEAKPDSPLGVLGPGTGLGVSGLIRSGMGWTALAGEGGHSDLSATTQEESQIIDILRQEHGHCSEERVLSGPGLVNLFKARERHLGRTVPDINPEDITNGALTGDIECLTVMNLFFAFLGNSAGNLALLLGAHGGVYIGGGVVPKCIDLIDDSPFREKFEAKGRYRDYLSKIPTFVITGETPALTGLHHYLMQQEQG